MSLDFAAESAQRFAPLARRFCAWVELRAKMPVGDADLHDLHAIVAELQAAAARIPNAGSWGGKDDAVEEAAEAAAPDDVELRRARDLAAALAEQLPVREYIKLLDPFGGAGSENVVGFTIDDDLGDIYHDLREGIALYELGKPGDAVWQWWFSYWTHWGRHATGLQTALWSHLAEGGGYTA